MRAQFAAIIAVPTAEVIFKPTGAGFTAPARMHGMRTGSGRPGSRGRRGFDPAGPGPPTRCGFDPPTRVFSAGPGSSCPCGPLLLARSSPARPSSTRRLWLRSARRERRPVVAVNVRDNSASLGGTLAHDLRLMRMGTGRLHGEAGQHGSVVHAPEVAPVIWIRAPRPVSRLPTGSAPADRVPARRPGSRPPTGFPPTHRDHRARLESAPAIQPVSRKLTRFPPAPVL